MPLSHIADRGAVSGIYRPTRLRRWCSLGALCGAGGMIGAKAVDELSHKADGEIPSAAIVGHLRRNSCGAAMAAPDPWPLPVRVSKLGSVVRWIPLDRSAPVSATLDASQRAYFNSSTVVELKENNSSGRNCVMQRDDQIVLFFHAGEPSKLQGDLTYTFGALTTPECASELVVEGGRYETLPCSIEYEIAAGPASAVEHRNNL